MFKRILKIVGIVLLGAVLLVGGVTAFLAIRGDFKKKVVKPTQISFEVNRMEVEYDVSVEENENICSFIISTQPADVTVKECTIKLSNSSLITFKKKVFNKDKGVNEWVDYDSTVFYLNEPIYFVVNDVKNEEDYNDGILKITVEDKSGLLQTSMNLEIDRKVTSISIKDINNPNNNKIANGLFVYENVDDSEEQSKDAKMQNIECIIGQDYPLEVITAPLMSLKPFANKDAKVYEIYYMEGSQPKLLTHEGSVVKLQTRGDQDELISESCDFLRFDEQKGIYVLNSQVSTIYDFKLAVYRTYKDQEQYFGQENVQLGEHLSYMLQKNVRVRVTGTEAENVDFFGNSKSFDLNLFERNELIVNNPDVQGDVFNLGLTLYKNDSLAEIDGRFNELQFLEDNSFNEKLALNFKDNLDDKNIITISFFADPQYGVKRATVKGMSAYGVPELNYYTKLAKVQGENLQYILTLRAKTADADGVRTCTLTINLTTDQSGRILTVLSGKLNEAQQEEESEEDNSIETCIKVNTEFNTSATFGGVSYTGGNCIIVDKAVNIDYENDAIKNSELFTKGEEVYNFKTFNPGVHLVFVEIVEDATSKTFSCVNNKFETEIRYDENNGKNTKLIIKPVDGSLVSKNKFAFYAIVVNENGTYAFTENSAYMVNMHEDPARVVVNHREIYLPVTLNGSGEIDYGAKDVIDENIVVVTEGSYRGVLFFAPKSEYKVANASWKGDKYTKTEIEGSVSFEKFDGEPSNGTTYYKLVKNNYKFIESISYIENGIEYYLLGYVNQAGQFVNEIVATGINEDSSLYVFVPRTGLAGSVQSAESYITKLIDNSDGLNYSKPIDAYIDGSESAIKIKYDKSLLPGRLIYIQESVSGSNSSEEQTPTDPGEEIEHSEQLVGSANSGWNKDENCYYVIKSVEFGNNVTIKATKYVKENGEFKAQDGEVDITIENDKYQGSKIEISPALFTPGDASLQIIVNSYYDFEHFASSSKVTIGGDYFEQLGGEDKNNNEYTIIECHKDIDIKVNLQGEKDIKDLTAVVSLSIDNDNALSILNGSKDKFSVNIYEYDASGHRVAIASNLKPLSLGDVSLNSPKFKNDTYANAEGTLLESEPSDWSKNYINYKEIRYEKVVGAYDDDCVYYTYDQGAYQVFEINEDIIANWSDNKDNYYVRKLIDLKVELSVEFSANYTLDDAHYVTIAFKYNYGDADFEIESPKIYISSRKVQNYQVNLPSGYYQATVLNNEPDNWTDNYVNYYTVDLENGKFVKLSGESPDFETGKYYRLANYLVLDIMPNDWEDNYTSYYQENAGVYTKLTGEQAPNFEANRYYKLDNYNGKVTYKIIVGYNSGYTYTVYACDDNYNFLYNADYEFISTTLDKAFSSDADGWIKINPYYAKEVDFNVDCKEYMDYEGDGNAKTLKILKLSGDAVDVKLINDKEPTIFSTIKVKIVQDDKFTLEFPNDITSSGLKETLNISYKYNDNNIVNDTIVKCEVIGGNGFITVEYVDDEYKVKRDDYTNIDAQIKISTLLGEQTITVTFTNPYNIYGSSSNSTKEIYSGTTFVLAYTGTENYSGSEDYLYRLISNSNIAFTMKVNGSVDENIDTTVSNIIKYHVPNVTEPTDYTFDIYYGEKKVSSFTLTVRPNLFIRHNTDEYILLNDADLHEYDFNEFKVYSYDATNAYTSYSISNANEVENIAKSYSYNIYTDENFTNEYNVNIINIDADNVLSVSKLPDKATYYVKVDVSSGGVNLGTAKFKIESKTNLYATKDLEIDAKQDTKFTRDELNKVYNVTINGSNVEISDILWLDYQNKDLSVTYNYENVAIRQSYEWSPNKNDYNYYISIKGIEGLTIDKFEYIGSNYGMAELRYVYQENALYNGETKLNASLVGHVLYGDGAIYGTQNTYLFQNGTKIIAITTGQDSYKLILVFNISDNNIQLNKVEEFTGGINNLTFNYAGYGEDLTANADFVAHFGIKVSVIANNESPFVFNSSEIGVNQINEIKVRPLKLEKKNVTIYTDYTYKLVDGTLTSEIFNIDKNIKAIEFYSTSSNFVITKTGVLQEIKANPNGNEYQDEIIVRLIYKNDEVYQYTETLTIKNKTIVKMSYPFVSNDEVFVENVDEVITNVINGLAYDTTDLKKYLGADTFSFDLMLKGDTLNFTEDNLLNIVRFNVSDISKSGEEVSRNKVRPGRIEIVAVSASLANTLSNVKQNINIVSELGQIYVTNNFMLTGFVVLKVYVEDNSSSAYGYYIVKIVDDNKFSGVLVNNKRETQIITIPTGASEVDCINAILNNSPTLATVAHISNQLVTEADKYLFNIGDEIIDADNQKIFPHQIINNGALKLIVTDILPVNIAVVLRYNTSLVHVCNYTLIFRPDVEVSPNEGTNTINANYAIYNAPAIQNFDFVNSDNNSKGLSDYLTVTTASEPKTSIGLTSAELTDSETLAKFSLSNSAGISINENYVKYNGENIGEISGTIFNYIAPVSEQVRFFITLNYGDFKAYVMMTLKPYQFAIQASTIGIGEWEATQFNHKILISNLIGSYSKAREISYSTSKTGIYSNVGTDALSATNPVNTEQSPTYLYFYQQPVNTTIYIKIRLTDTIPAMEKIYEINIASNISSNYTHGESETDRVTAIVETQTGELNNIGSSLYVDISSNVVKIMSKSDGDTYLTINTGGVSSITFNLYDGTDNANAYFADYNGDLKGKTLTESGKLEFVHSVNDKSLRLEILISNDTMAYPAKSMFITIPKTYDLVANFRANGATYETILAGEALSINATNENMPADNYLFGSAEEVENYAYASRFSIKIGGEYYYGANNLVGLGLRNENNPNYLIISLDSSSQAGCCNIGLSSVDFINPGIIKLLLTNATMNNNVEYEFRIQSVEDDYNTITFNPNYMYTTDATNGDYISITSNDLNSDDFYLASLKYSNTGANGNVAYVSYVNNNLKLGIDGNKIVRTEGSNTVNSVTEIKIITMNGVAKTIKLVITNFNFYANYGEGNTYETIYANTEGYKLTDPSAQSGAYSRLRVANYHTSYDAIISSNSGVFTVASGYTFTYKGSLNGTYSTWGGGRNIDYTPSNRNLIYCNSNGGFQVYSVKENTYVTMAFEVTYNIDGNYYVIGVALYSLCIKNDIEIGLNGTSEFNTIADLYLGNAYNVNNNKVTIDLLDNRAIPISNLGYNNLFVTLYRFTDGRYLYNAEDADAVYQKGSVGNHLIFSVSNSVGIRSAEVDASGILKIDGNNAGSFDLIVTSKVVPGYYKTFTIIVHPLEKVVARHENSINTNSGSGWISGQYINLIKSNGNENNTSYALDMNKLSSYVDNGEWKTKLETLNGVTNAVIKYSVKISDNNTPIASIKNNSGWGNEESVTFKDDKECKLALPAVPYPTDSADRLYYIVSYRVAVTVNGTTNYYYAHYLVYNASNVIVNDLYSQSNKNKVVTYSEGAWNSGNTLTLMDLNNTGMYALVSLLREKPTNWDTDYTNYYRKDENGKYLAITDDATPVWTGNTYYQINNVVKNISNLTIRFTNMSTNKEFTMSGSGSSATINYVDNNKITVTLSEKMFENAAQFKVEFLNGNNVLLTDYWTFKSNSAITPKDSLPLSELFLRSEIGAELYNKSIVGFGNEYDSFVNNGERDTNENVETLGSYNGFVIQKVKYIFTDSECDVFTNVEYFLVLDTKPTSSTVTAMGLDFNGGTYYINLRIDDSAIAEGKAEIDLSKFVKIWSYSDGKFVSTSASSVTWANQAEQTANEDITSNNSKIELNNVDKYNSNFEYLITITAEELTRNVAVRFDFVLSAKSLVKSDGTPKTSDATIPETDYEYLAYNANLDAFMYNKTGNQTIESSALRAELLELIWHNGRDVSITETANFAITAELKDSYYEITYTYNYAGTSYSRTFKMVKSTQTGS